MTLIVEDGSIVPGANSYADLVYLDRWHGARATKDLWMAMNTLEREAIAIDETAALDVDAVWRGTPVDQNQPLDWPRFDVVTDEQRFISSNTVPEGVLKALANRTVMRLSREDPSIVSERGPDYAITRTPSLAREPDRMTRVYLRGLVIALESDRTIRVRGLVRVS